MEGKRPRPRRAAAVRASSALSAEGLFDDDDDDAEGNSSFFFGSKVSRDVEAAHSVSPAEASALVASSLTEVVAVTGSGISASSGLSTFYGGATSFYERARKKFKLKDGKELFQWKFYAERPYDALQFLGEMCEGARKCKPTPTHRALAALERRGALRRHYTMNIDGLHAKAGMASYDDGGRTVELHGSLMDLVDVETGAVYDVDDDALRRIRKKKPAIDDSTRRTPKRVVDLDLSDDDDDGKKEEEEREHDDDDARSCRVRFRVMFYGDKEHACVLDAAATLGLLKDDATRASIVLWLGISFQQSASCDYLRRVVAVAPPSTVHLVVNPCAEAAFNARSCLEKPGNVDLRAVYATSDDLFAALNLAVPSLFVGGDDDNNKDDPQPASSSGTTAAAAEDPPVAVINNKGESADPPTTTMDAESPTPAGGSSSAAPTPVKNSR